MNSIASVLLTFTLSYHLVKYLCSASMAEVSRRAMVSERQDCVKRAVSGQEHSVTLNPGEPEVYNKMYSSPLRQPHFSLFCIALYGTDGIPDDDPALQDVSGAVRGVLIIGGTRGLLFCWQRQTVLTNKDRKYQAFRVACSELVY